MINFVLFLAVLVAAAWIAWRRGARVIAAVIALFALLPTMTLLRELPWPAYLVLVAALGTTATAANEFWNAIGHIGVEVAP